MKIENKLNNSKIKIKSNRVCVGADDLIGSLKNKNGITAIALIITIILLLILAGVVISLTLGKNGLFNTAKYAVTKTQEESAKEKVQLMLADYMKERYISTKTLEEYLNEQKKNGELDEVTNNNDGTITVKVDGYEITIREKDLSVIGAEKTGGAKPKIEVQITTIDGTELTGEELQKALTINIINISEYGNNYMIEVEDSTGNKITKQENVIENLTGQASYIITETGNYTIRVKGTKEGLERTTEIVKMIRIEKLNDWKNLVTLAKLNISDYSDLNDVINNEHAMNQILESEEATNYLINSTEIIFPSAIQNEISAEKILNNENAMKLICNSQTARTILYDNANITESLIQNSQVALNVMRSSSNCELMKICGQARYNNTIITNYSGKAFVLSFSCDGYTGRGAGTIYHGSYIVNENSFLGANPTDAYGTNGEKIVINKFASSVQAYRTEYTDRAFYYYALIFKI